MKAKKQLWVVIFAILAVLMLFSLAGCAGNDVGTSSGKTENESSANDINANQNSNDSSVSNDSQSESSSEMTENDSTDTVKVLIAYFSYSENANLPDGVDASTSASIQLLDGKITGNTGLIANYIQKATGGDLFSIRTVKTYSDNYNTAVNEGRTEKNNNEKPELSTHIENLDEYGTVFIGFPNWWYGMPMALYSFLDEYDFSGKTIVPFCTSGGSAFSDAIDEIKKAEPNATVLDGLHIGESRVSSSESEVREWVNGLSLTE